MRWPCKAGWTRRGPGFSNPCSSIRRMRIRHFHYAMSLSAQRQAREAMVEYRKALALDDQLLLACNNLAWMLASHPDPQIRNGKEAVGLGERACRLTNYEQPFYLGTLAAAYAEAGRFNDAIATAEKARDLARKGRDGKGGGAERTTAGIIPGRPGLTMNRRRPIDPPARRRVSFLRPAFRQIPSRPGRRRHQMLR